MRFRYSAEENGKPVKIAEVYTQNEHGINFSDVDSEAVYVIERLRANGFETYIVGGAVRDLILGKKPKDFDIVSSASPAKIKRIFRNARIIGHRFRLVHVYFGPKIFEVSTFRSLKDGPTSNTFGTIEEDVQRRDFTLNALFYDPLKQIVVDYVGGMKDIKAKKIKPIIPLTHIFTDDPVRMIRAVKYGASTGFKLPLSLKWKIRKQSSLLEAISASRLTEEIFKILHSSQAAAIVASLDSMGLYQYLQPRAAELFKAKAGFREQYLKTMSTLNQRDFRNLPGEALASLVRDYLEENADWDGEEGGQTVNPPSERYKEAFALARQFVLPMNPPRMELDHGVRLLFAEHGVTIKKSRFTERGGRRGPESPAPESTEAEGDAPPSTDDQAPKRKRRRRHKPRKETPESQE
ncbi:polynucleotide adenylyltransferase PcnB [Leadbettera azotonutricia]|uniref:Poly(A) polymerase (PAP) (Plasmid copy number protein) n=1 Tax=Leadbettera azotonutricia (strain ATCC BAA-888 / DSM 13862 / ZAS-9) TaxID=545695 RepID=F5YE51_LEAAZ|nr:polynucleotide adenylyltransferase PcnB [Leadbettera azotonutricia]AEF81178.1 poly(A) polymerase (PAP) (Plasmid copy number protein) [Leadbettera azotonutricia ZAS-9]